MIDSQGAFTVIGDDRKDGGSGDVRTYYEVLYEADPEDPWTAREEVGTAYAAFVLTPNQLAVVNITLSFGEEDSVSATGVLSHGEETLERGVLTVTGGTGRFKYRRGQLRVDHRNPHKYSGEP